MKKIKVFALLLTTLIAVTACSDDKMNTVSEESHTTTTSTSSVSAVNVTAPVEYDSILDKYKTELTIIRENDTPQLYYCFFEESSEMAKVFVQFHEDNIEDNVSRIDDILDLRTSSPWLREYQSVYFEFSDKNEELLMTKFDMLGMSWYDDAYEQAYSLIH